MNVVVNVKLLHVTAFCSSSSIYLWRLSFCKKKIIGLSLSGYLPKLELEHVDIELFLVATVAPVY
jgi:hypothetical protein